MTGRKIHASYGYEERFTFYAEIETSPGIIFVKIETTDHVYYRKIPIQNYKRKLSPKDQALGIARGIVTPSDINNTWPLHATLR